jgi:hypothetical protein
VHESDDADAAIRFLHSRMRLPEEKQVD